MTFFFTTLKGSHVKARSGRLSTFSADQQTTHERADSEDAQSLDNSPTTSATSPMAPTLNIPVTDAHFLKPTDTAPKNSEILRLKTLRSNKYTPRILRKPSRLQKSPTKSLTSEFDRKLVTSAELHEMREIEDLLLDEASSIFTSDNQSVTQSSAELVNSDSKGTVFVVVVFLIIKKLFAFSRHDFFFLLLLLFFFLQLVQGNDFFSASL